MSSKKTILEREEFIRRCEREGGDRHGAELILRHAATVQRCAEAECSYDDPIRATCPACGGKGCNYCGETRHVTRAVRSSFFAERRIVQIVTAWGWQSPIFGGDPRGACVKLRVPSGYTDDWGHMGLCVPTR